MDLETYAKHVGDFCVYPGKGTDMGFRTYSLIGLCGEVGELADQVAKAARDDHPGTRKVINIRTGFTPMRNVAVRKELGDVIFMWIACCLDLGYDPREVLNENVDKLLDRLERGVIQGEGDDR
jgi:NTP pyrophosphatase (non-canonical NTP hydrolase)